MQIGSLVYIRSCLLPDGTVISAIGVIKSIRAREGYKIMEVWFPEFGYSIDFEEQELILLEDYHGYTER